MSEPRDNKREWPRPTEREYRRERLGLTPLHMAAASGDAEHIKELLDGKGKEELEELLEARTVSGDSPLHSAVTAIGKDNSEVVQVLLAFGADAEALNRLGQTALELAERYERSGCVDALKNGKARTLAGEGSQSVLGELPTDQDLSKAQ